VCVIYICISIVKGKGVCEIHMEAVINLSIIFGVPLSCFAFFPSLLLSFLPSVRPSVPPSVRPSSSTSGGHKGTCTYILVLQAYQNLSFDRTESYIRINFFTTVVSKPRKSQPHLISHSPSPSCGVKYCTVRVDIKRGGGKYRVIVQILFRWTDGRRGGGVSFGRGVNSAQYLACRDDREGEGGREIETRTREGRHI
jgi:hypothetical protein